MLHRQGAPGMWTAAAGALLHRSWRGTSSDRPAPPSGWPPSVRECWPLPRLRRSRNNSWRRRARCGSWTAKSFPHSSCSTSVGVWLRPCNLRWGGKQYTWVTAWTWGWWVGYPNSSTSSPNVSKPSRVRRRGSIGVWPHNTSLSPRSRGPSPPSRRRKPQPGRPGNSDGSRLSPGAPSGPPRCRREATSGSKATKEKGRVRKVRAKERKEKGSRRATQETGARSGKATRRKTRTRANSGGCGGGALSWRRVCISCTRWGEAVRPCNSCGGSCGAIVWV